jgi:hypothetical protein
MTSEIENLAKNKLFDLDNKLSSLDEGNSWFAVNYHFLKCHGKGLQNLFQPELINTSP